MVHRAFALLQSKSTTLQAFVDSGEVKPLLFEEEEEEKEEEEEEEKEEEEDRQEEAPEETAKE